MSCPIARVDFEPAYAGNTHTAHVTAPAELGDIEDAAIWWTLRLRGEVVLRKRNAAAGGDDDEITIIIPSEGKFDINILKGDTAGLEGDLDYEIYMEGVAADTTDYAQSIAQGTWHICASISDTSI